MRHAAPASRLVARETEPDPVNPPQIPTRDEPNARRADEPPLLSARGLCKNLGARVLLADVDLGIAAGDRIGLVGVNGAGKSTLIRALVGPEVTGDSGDVPDDGIVAKRRGLKIAYVPQEPVLPAGASVALVLRAAQAEHVELCARFDALSDRLSTLDGLSDADALEDALHAQQVLMTQIEAMGGWDLDHQIRGLSAALGVPSGERIVDTLSVGERRRVALACALLAGPELLALDEPTNHLDTATTEWLEGRLRTFPGAVLLVTHDRWFLERVATRIAEIDRGHLHVYLGGYTRFLEQRAARLDAESESERQRSSFVRRELEWVRRGPQARSTKQQARLERFDAAVAARPDDVRPDDRELALRIPTGPRLGGIVLEAKELGHSLGGKVLFRGLDFAMVAGDRVGIVGGNGMGKSTLLRVLLGELQPDLGSVKRGLNTLPIFLDQTRSTLDDRQTVIEAVAAQNDHVFLEDGPVHVRTFLRMMLLDDRVAAAKVSELSGGERNRVTLARLLREGGNLLVLDEPTNDLDLMTLSALEEALSVFPGCALVVSHDRWFLDRVATSILAFEGDGRVTRYAGNYSDFLSQRASGANGRVETRAADERTSAPPEASKASSNASSNAASKASSNASSNAAVAPKAPKARIKSGPEKRELAAMEASIEAAEREVAEVNLRMNDPKLYSRGGAEITAVQVRLERAQAEVARLYARWEALLELA